jgi:HEAT repeat protein
MPANSIIDQADRELLYEILYALKEGGDDERRKAVEDKVPKLGDKQAARDEFIHLLDYSLREERAGWDEWTGWEDSSAEVRGWAATALAKLCGKGDKTTRDAVSNRLKVEKEAVSRYWMLLALYGMGSQKEIEGVVRGIADDYTKQLDADQDPSFEGRGHDNSRAGPLALAILASWKDRAAAERLETMLKSQDFEWMWSVCRALEVVSCREMLEPLRHVAEDPRTWPDIRNKCVKALGLIDSPAAARALGRVLTGTRDAIIKESAIEGLERLGQSRLLRGMLDQLEKAGEARYSVADSLMAALRDGNAQIRRRAAEALPKVMINLDAYQDGDREAYDKALAQARIPATEKVVAELVRERVDLKEGVPLLVDALRVIDPPEAEAAATVLSYPKYLFSEDVSVKQRAGRALKLVGGEKAVQTLMGQKSDVLRAYSDLLAKADEPVQELFKETMLQAQRSFRISQGMSITIFVIGVGVLISGLYIAFTAGQERLQLVFGAGVSVVSMIAVVLDMMLRDPHQRVQEATSVLLRIKVIFLGYVRQIHQVDATFKHEFIEGGKEFGVKEVQETIKQINDVMKNTMDMISLHLPVREAEKLAVDEVLKPWQERLEAATKALEEKGKAPVEEDKEKEKKKADATTPALPDIGRGREGGDAA